MVLDYWTRLCMNKTHSVLVHEGGVSPGFLFIVIAGDRGGGFSAWISISYSFVETQGEGSLTRPFSSMTRWFRTGLKSS